jgi:hypothetical protein
MDEETPLPIRDIVIETRVDVRHIREALDKIAECIKDHDERLREIEIKGSEVSRDAVQNLVKLNVRVTRLESGEQTDIKVASEKRHWVDSIWTKIGIIAGIVFAFLAFLKSYLPWV